MVARKRKLTPHPVAELFPMLTTEDMNGLADDIRERGLLHPIVLDADGQILDGRNRLAACEIAGVEPIFTTYEGDDPGGYALAVNIARRNLTKGQSAMVAARERLISKRSQRATAGQFGVNAGRLGQASVIIEFAPDLVDQVISGGLPLDAAYVTAKDRKRAKTDGEAATAELREKYPELVEQVSRGDLSLAEALKVGRDRAKAARQHEIDQATRLANNVFSGLELQHQEVRENYVQYWLGRCGDVSGVIRASVTPENVQAVGEAYVALAGMLKEAGVR